MTVGLALAACLAASYYDVRWRRIPNWLTALTAVTAIVVHAFFGWASLGLTLAVMAVLTLAGAFVYSRGGIGGGDIKLAVAASGLLGYPLCVPFLLYTAIAGGLLALLFLTFRRNARASVSRVVSMAFVGMQPTAGDKSETLPYAVAFTLGAIVIALSQSVVPSLRIML